MELLKQLNAIRDATNRSLMLSSSSSNNNNNRDSDGYGNNNSQVEVDEKLKVLETVKEEEEEEEEEAVEKTKRRRPFKYARALRSDDFTTASSSGTRATITCAAQNGAACAFGFDNGDLLVADAKTGERVALFQEEAANSSSSENGNADSSNRITCISFDATGTFLCSSSANGTVKVRHVVVVDDDDEEEEEEDDEDDSAPKTPKVSNNGNKKKSKKKIIRVHDDVDGESLIVTHKSSVNC